MNAFFSTCWKSGVAVVLLALWGFAPAFADGTETLGPPSVTLASGSGMAAAGVGLATQPGIINITVPVVASVEQILLYWEGHNFSASGDNTIIVNGTEVTGTLIGGPTLFFLNGGTTPTYSTTFRADITALGVVTPGANAVTVEGLAYDLVANGAGIIAVYDDGTDTELFLVDGNDCIYKFFAPPLDASVAQTFTFGAATTPRVAPLSMFFSSVQGLASTGGILRPSRISVTVGGVTTNHDNILDSNEGEEWDTFIIGVNIPAGETQLTVRAFSGPVGDEDPNTPTPRPASFTWTSAALAVPVPEEQCNGKIGNFVWKDKDCDGKQDSNEPGIPGITIQLTDSDGNIWTTVTNSSGFYYFDSLCADTYTIEYDESTVPEGLIPTVCINTPGAGTNSNCSPTTVVLTTNASTDLTIDFGFCNAPNCCGKIGNRVWKDKDCDGKQDSNEPGIKGVKIKLNGPNGLVRTTVTDKNGYYYFTGLCAGTYTITVDAATVPSGYVRSTCSNVANNGTNSNCSPATAVLSSHSKQDLTIDFGYCEQGGGKRGCTTGYWKQCHHFDSWPHPYKPWTKFKDVFDKAFGSKTLFQVLSQGGGGLNALGRQTVAALLNAKSSGVNYNLTTQQVISMFNNVYPGSNSNYETLKNIFEDYNEQGCPLNRSGVAGEEGQEVVPTVARLMQNYPNPFNPETAIYFVVPEASQVSLKIFNTLGQEVRVLMDGMVEAGMHEVTWDGRDAQGMQVGSGIYFYQMRAGDVVEMKKMSLLK